MPTPPTAGRARRVMRELAIPAATALAMAFVVQSAVAKPFEVPTGSMEPTIMPGDRVIANRLIYRTRDVRRGDVVVFSPPAAARVTCNRADPFVKRVVGLPGDRVTVVDGGPTLVNGAPLSVEGPRVPHYGMAFPSVPPGHLLVLGDNRDASCDGHMWSTGHSSRDPFVPMDAVIGQAEVTYWPPSRLRLLN